MRKPGWPDLALAILICTLPVQPALAQEYTDITVDQAYDLLSSDPSIFLLDVRNPSEYEDGHISGSYLIPNYELASRLNELPSDKSGIIIVYCGSGGNWSCGRSATSSRELAGLGYTNVHNIIRGFTEWQSKGYPSTIGKDRGVFPVPESFLLFAVLSYLAGIRRLLADPCAD